MCNRAAGDPLTKFISMLMPPGVGFSRWETWLLTTPWRNVCYYTSRRATKRHVARWARLSGPKIVRLPADVMMSGPKIIMLPAKLTTKQRYSNISAEVVAAGWPRGPLAASGHPKRHGTRPPGHQLFSIHHQRIFTIIEKKLVYMGLYDW
jgi:hypothetical protein